MTINQIVRNTVERLKIEGKVWTPDVYSETFCSEAKKAGFAVEDCSGIDRFIPLMDKKTQEEVKQYRVKTAQELIRFLISKMSRMNPSEASVLVETLSSLTQVMAKSTDLLHNPDASALAKKTITILETQGGKTQIELLRQAWENFVTVYDDAFLTKLAQFGDVDKRNLKKTVEGLSGDAQINGGANYKEVASLIILGLSPSIAPKMSDDLSKLAQKVHEEPDYISHATFDNEIKTAIAMRIALDKKSVNELIRSLDELLGKLSAQLIDLIERSDISSVEIKSIKKDLEGLTADKTGDFKTAHKRLYSIASALEEKVEVLSKDLKSHNEQVVHMGTRIATLEAELAEANQASREDFLTKLYNKRAIDEFLLLKEADYERHGRHYCIAMFDLDHFKAVNDTYGHDAGDMVLKAFSRILKEEGRTNDIIGRFGGEEFLAILGDTNLEGAKNFANKVRLHVEEARFMYQEKRINLTVSVGIAERSSYASLNNTLLGADEQLYAAKKKGRNRVEPA
ncbi:MAG: GGDEF domain-containing protein [Sulfuricurvum sp.]|uniref:GGDEF domain-containing protein n=1 Tax=Sulfuricurvum sp. TaxID=2025608 RepID=UPI00262E32CD|nr:GGDEF domain-containing protein [Sulfuricurvum sp.]MDD2829176.1 GGDEF domain-containing protein [Sulfuricurvum sp.]MDD4949009.1 GGDEF domain-containing protein [Sulfuricurvum sp.]